MWIANASNPSEVVMFAYRFLPVLVLLLLVTGSGAAQLRLALAQTELRLHPDPEAYAAHMAARMAAAMEQKPDLVLFPEDIGLPLALVDDYAVVRDCKTTVEAATALIKAHQADIAPLCGQGMSPQRALLTLKAPRVDELYRQVFGGLARQYHVYVAAGSAPLPSGAAVGNVAYLFGPDGELAGTQGKKHLIDLEGPEGLDLCPVIEKTLWQTPLGKLGMIICADAWDAQVAADLKRQGAQVLLNCLANPEPWSDAQQTGMDGGSLPARVAETGLPGAQCYGVGRLFDLSFNGKSQLLRPLRGNRWEAIARAKSADKEELVAGVLELAVP